VTYAREKRLLLGAAALLVAVPLPFNQVLEWSALLAFLVVVAGFVRRAWYGSERWLQARALNLLGLAYLPVLFFDLNLTGRIQPIRPILHLFLFGLGAKLWSLGRERDKWQAWIGVFFLFLAAMATSTHPAVVLYLLAFGALAAVLMLRFVHLHVLSSFGRRDAPSGGLPIARFVAALLAATAVVAAPLFALLPRVRSPLVAAGGGLAGAQPGGAAAGFSDEMSLDLIGRIRDNPEVALRLRFAGEHPSPESLRLKASTFDLWQGRSWRASPRARRLVRETGVDVYRLAPGRSVGSAQIFLEPIRTITVPVPQESIELEIGASVVQLDEGGALGLPGPPSTVLDYSVRLGSNPRSLAVPPSAGDVDPALDANGTTRRMVELARAWAGEGDAATRARRIEERFHREFLYTTAFIGRGGSSPLEWFLFEAKRGHCEYFASAMVLLLRAEAIPARLVTGFYGAEWSPWESSWIVRQSNAHAWVEAWIDGEGWLVYDPTPPSGLPSASARDLRLYFLQAWDAVLFRWDRWVISYDFEDQVGLIGGLRRYWGDLMRDLFGAEKRPEAEPLRADVPAADAGGAAAASRDSTRARWWLVAAIVVAAAIAAATFWFWRRGPAWSATLAYTRLRLTLRAAGLPVRESTAPLALAELAARRLPTTAGPAARVVDGYLEEAFAERPVSFETAAALRRDLAAVELAVRQARKSRRPPARAA
jgi:transglutaminase-like putative cysteine protease